MVHPERSSTRASATRSSRTDSRRTTSSARSRASTATTSSCSRSVGRRPRAGSRGSRSRRTRPVPTSRRWPRPNSDGAEKTQGGDLGWVAPLQLDAEREQAIFAAPIGKVSDTLKTDSGYYVFLVRDRAEPAAGRRPARDAEGQRVHELVRDRDGRRRTSRPTSRPAAPSGRIVLDALLAEARLRWGLDPAGGVQVVAAEHLIGTPIEPSRPVLVVPLAILLGRAGGPADEAGHRRRASGRRPVAGPRGPGRGRADRAPRPALPGGPSGRSVPGRGGDDGRCARTGRPDRAALPPPGQPRGRGRRAMGDALDLRPAAATGRLSVGPRADPRDAPEAPPRGELRGLRRARSGRFGRSGRGARRPPPPGRPPRPARAPRRASST